MNEIFLQGFLCKAPVYRKTPLGREIADVLLAVNREYGRTDYIPCIVWGAECKICVQTQSWRSGTGNWQNTEPGV